LDLEEWKLLDGTPLALVSTEFSPADISVLRERGRGDTYWHSVLGEKPSDSYSTGVSTIAWNGQYVLGSRYETKIPWVRSEPRDCRARWYLIQLNASRECEVMYDGYDRSEFSRAVEAAGIQGELVPRTLAYYWPNWSESALPHSRSDIGPDADAIYAGSSCRDLAGAPGYYLLDAMNTFLTLRGVPPGPGAPNVRAFGRSGAGTPDRSDLVRIAWDGKFIVADVCFLITESAEAGPTVDRSRPIATMIVDMHSGKASGLIDKRFERELRRRFGVPERLVAQDVVRFWPDWVDIRHKWRSDPRAMKYLGLE
jgi:hypothetical protein